MNVNVLPVATSYAEEVRLFAVEVDKAVFVERRLETTLRN